jgi:hypothetical protein
MASFQLFGLAAEAFAHLKSLDGPALAAQGVRKRVATASAAYPCRVSLRDAEEGEELWLLSYEHLAVDSPYRASGPIFVRVGAVAARLAPGEVPPYVTARLISLRAYNARHFMVAAEVSAGEDVAEQLGRLFEREEVEYVQLHNARPGCFSCEARRAAEVTG